MFSPRVHAGIFSRTSNAADAVLVEFIRPHEASPLRRQSRFRRILLDVPNSAANFRRRVQVDEPTADHPWTRRPSIGLPTTLQRMSLLVVQTPCCRSLQKSRHVFNITLPSAGHKMNVVWHDRTGVNVKPEISHGLSETIANHSRLPRSELNRSVLEMLLCHKPERSVVLAAGQRLTSIDFRGIAERLKMLRPNLGGP